MAGVNPILAGIACRCPSCGRGPLYSGFMQIARGCPACGEGFDRADSRGGETVLAAVLLIGLCCVAALLAGHGLQAPLNFTLQVLLPAAVVLALLLIRPLKGVMAALRFHRRFSQTRRGRS
jgi:uncharacterized protein (DUF983 family)